MIDKMQVSHFEFNQRTGDFNVIFADTDTPLRMRVFLASGYAGTKHGRNNPDAQCEKAVGPIPRGRWVLARPRDHAQLGQYAIGLTPDLATETCGRSGFYIHGDSAKRPGDASRGCIVLHRTARECIHALNALFDGLPLFVV